MEDKLRFWENALPEIQDKNISIFKELLEIHQNNEYYLHKIFNATNKAVLEHHSNELLELFKKYKDSDSIVQKAWESLDSRMQEDNTNILVDIINEREINGKDISDIWKATNEKAQQQILDIMLQKAQGKKDFILQIWKGLNVELSEENFYAFINLMGLPIENFKQSYDTYKKIISLNPNINLTLDPNMLDDKVLNLFEAEKLVRICNYEELQKNILNLIKIPGCDKLIETVSKDSDNWVMELDNIMKNISQFPELMYQIPNEKMNTDRIDMLIQVFSQRENYFNIKTSEEVENYFNIRNEICKKLLNETQIDNLHPIIANYSKEDQKRFALLQMFYGIDIQEARNLVEKYGKDVEEILEKQNEDKTASKILGIKRILECDNIKEKYAEYKEIINNELEDIEYSSIAMVEAECINMYAQMYDKTLYKLSELDKVFDEEYEGKKVEVFEINKDFNMFVRTNGACNGWNEPENFATQRQNSNTLNHGNCKSFVGQDCIAIAKSTGPKYGYSYCEENSLLLAAPWDIMSNAANKEFSTASTKWDFNSGIQFRIPQKMIDHTRYGYNEIVSERLIYDEQTETFKQDKPQYIVYVQEPEKNRQEDDQWRISKKAASQLGIPIVIIDREKFAKREAEKIKNLEDIFLGKAENTEQLTEKELIERIIVKFENNSIGIQSSESLCRKYFTVEQRTNMVKNIWGKIKTSTQMTAIILMFLDVNSYGAIFTGNLTGFAFALNLVTTLLMTISVIATIFSGYEYLKGGKELLKDC